MKYAWIQEHRDSYPVAVMCRVLQVSTSGFYRAGKAQPGPRAQRSERIRQAVAAVYQASNQVYGSHKIARALQADATLASACRNTVIKAIQEMGLKSRVSQPHMSIAVGNCTNFAVCLGHLAIKGERSHAVGTRNSSNRQRLCTKAIYWARPIAARQLR